MDSQATQYWEPEELLELEVCVHTIVMHCM